MPSILASTVFAATILGSGAAFAGPLGIGLPADPFYFDTTTSYESLVQNAGDVLTGIFTVDSIKSSLHPANPTYAYGSNGLFLTGVFTGFVLETPIINANNTVTLNFHGGSLNYYVSNSNNFTNTSGSTTTDVNSASMGSLWLSATPEVIDGAGHTLSITLNGATSASAFSDAATSNVLLDVTGGAAAAIFDSNTFFNSQTDTFADLLFKGSANLAVAGSCGDFGVCGSNLTKGFLIPEPLTLSVFGAGLAGAAALRRKKAKKA
jgi:hypothetical protein